MYQKWIDATLPEMGRFVWKNYEFNVRIIVLNEDLKILHTMEPDGNAGNSAELTLVRSDDYRFRLASSSSFNTGTGLMSLFECLVTYLKEKRCGYRLAMDAFYMFDCFTRSNTACPGLGETVKEIMDE